MAKVLKYDLIRLNILNYIAEKQLKPGDKLPPEREFVNIVPGSMISLRRALQELEYDGILERRTGGRNSGTYLRRGIYCDNWKSYILYINISRGGDMHTNPYLGDISCYFNARGLGVKYFNVNGITDEVIVKAHEASAIMLDGWYDDNNVKQLASLHLPLLLMGNRSVASAGQIPQIACNLKKASYIAYKQCVADGRKKIALLRGLDGYYPYDEYEAGYMQAVKEMHTEPVIGCVPQGGRLSDYLEEFMPANKDTDAWLMPHSMLDRVVSWYWRNGVTAQPEFIFLDHVPLFNDFRESEYMRWITFGSLGLTAASAVMQWVMYNAKPESIVLEPSFAGNKDINPIEGEL